MEFLYSLLVVILVINALFWSLFTHKQHCAVAKLFGIKHENCPSHWFHISFGIFCFLLAIVIQQRRFILG
tara:strand:+ start:1121 stop:1330 length:210 start_codon:yes stop_codon:yes gene_type:complete